MKQGQVTIIALFSTAVLFLVLVMIGVGSASVLNNSAGEDSLLGLILNYAWVFIGVAALVSFFIWMAVVKGQ